ncbi:MAG: transcriptional modulator of MazE/toxin, MazF [Rhodospirillales bacterium]|nr:transcriptional modulator of MazE/toxin, MazF [Rhodospirillales bacterium]
MKRGDLVTMAIGGDYGKPRPALVVQANPFAALPSVTVLRLTSDLGSEHLFRLTIQPTSENGLRAVSQIMIDKAVSIPREKIGKVFGHVDDAMMSAVSRALVVFLGLEGVTP